MSLSIRLDGFNNVSSDENATIAGKADNSTGKSQNSTSGEHTITGEMTYSIYFSGSFNSSLGWRIFLKKVNRPTKQDYDYMCEIPHTGEAAVVIIISSISIT